MQEGMDLKRTILAVVLSMAVLLVYQKYFAPQPSPKRVQQAGEKAAEPEKAAPVAAPAVPEQSPPPPASVPTAVAVPVRTHLLEGARLDVELSSRGGVVVLARVKDYTDRPGKGGRPVELLAASSGLDLAGTTRLVDANQGGDAVYETVAAGPDRATYRWVSPAGVAVEKTYRLAPDGYSLALDVRVTNGSDRALRDRLGVGLVQDYGAVEDKYTFFGPAYLQDGELEEVKLKKVKEGVSVDADVSWVALLEKYFLVAAIPRDGARGGLRLARHRGLEKVVEAELLGPVFDLNPGASVAYTYELYLGPKRSDALATLGSDFSKVVDYGFFDPLAKPLLWFLNTIYGFVGNYGVAIIVLTTLIKLVFWPLSARSFRSMQKMKELQPKMERLKERYGNDKERLNMEVMQLYKTHKVNPLGGCLPMVVQIPFFFALYKILLSSIELRHAPFIFWITDLSAKDPYYVTPLLMGASMFLQQKLTPSTGPNAAQMKMMMYGMPVVFTFLFLNFPSGLVIYWLVNNLLSIAQQAMMLRTPKTA